MRITVAVIDRDEDYLHRLNRFLVNDYADKIEVHSFSHPEQFLAELDEIRPQVLLASPEVEFDLAKLGALKDQIAFAYLVPSSDIEEWEGLRTVPKYSRLDDFFHLVQQLFLEVMKNVRLKGNLDSKIDSVVFTSPAGGVGTTTAAVSFAKVLGARGAKVLYINFDHMGNSDNYFSGQGFQTFSDVIFAVKSHRTNLGVLLDAIVRHDEESNVHFFAAAANPADRFEMTPDDEVELVRALFEHGDWDCIVYDLPYFGSHSFNYLFAHANQIVLVSDGHRNANDKCRKAISILKTLDRRHKTSIVPKIGVYYNRFSSKNTEKLTDLNLYEYGGTPRVEGGTDFEITESIIKSDQMDKLANEVLK